MSCLSTRITVFNLGRRLQPCCATCLKRSSRKFYKIVRRVCCRSSCGTLLLLLRQLLFQFQQVPVGSPSRLRGGNQAKKACSFKVSVFGSHVGPGSAKTDSFLVSSAHIQFNRCCGRYRNGAVWCSCGFFSWIQLTLLSDCSRQPLRGCRYSGRVPSPLEPLSLSHMRSAGGAEGYHGAGAMCPLR